MVVLGRKIERKADNLFKLIGGDLTDDPFLSWSGAASWLRKKEPNTKDHLHCHVDLSQ